MLSVHLICVGKLKEKFYLAACAEYQKRLGAYCKLELTELSEERLPQNPSRAQIDAALEREAAAIRGKIPQNSCLVALCVEGKQLSSEELAGWCAPGRTAPPGTWSLSSAAPSVWRRA